MYGPTHGPNLITAHLLLGQGLRLGFHLRLSAPNNLPHPLQPPPLLQPSFLCLPCQSFFLFLLQSLLLPQIGLFLLLEPNTVGFTLGLSGFDLDEGGHCDSMMIRKEVVVNGNGSG